MVVLLISIITIIKNSYDIKKCYTFGYTLFTCIQSTLHIPK